jgi:hypothetical protein
MRTRGRFGVAVLGVALALLLGGVGRAGAGVIVLDFNDVPAGTLAVFNPYTSQGFTQGQRALWVTWGDWRVG